MRTRPSTSRGRVRCSSQPSVPHDLRRAPVILLFALRWAIRVARRSMRSVGRGTISSATLNRVQKRVVLTTPSDGCATPGCLRHASHRRLIRRAVAPHRIEDPTQATGERHDRDAAPAPLRKPTRPPLQRIPRALPPHPPRGLNQETPRCRRPPLRDASATLPVGRTVFARHQAKVGTRTGRRPKAGNVIDRGPVGQPDNGSDARRRRQPPHDGILLRRRRRVGVRAPNRRGQMLEQRATTRPALPDESR